MGTGARKGATAPARPRGSHVHFDEQVVLGDSIARRGVDGGDGACGGRGQLVLHLHRFQHDDPLACFDRVAGGHQDAQYQTRHRGMDLAVGRRVAHVQTEAFEEQVGVGAEVNLDGGTVDPDTRGGALALDGHHAWAAIDDEENRLGAVGLTERREAGVGRVAIDGDRAVGAVDGEGGLAGAGVEGHGESYEHGALGSAAQSAAVSARARRVSLRAPDAYPSADATRAAVSSNDRYVSPRSRAAFDPS